MVFSEEEINSLDYRYFQKIKKIIEENGTTFLKNLTSHFQIHDSWSNYSGKMSFIQEGVERVVQSIVSNNVDWEVCSTPVGADSVFITSKAMIHIDSKAIQFSDGDATTNKVTLSKNQTSYATDEPIIYEGVPFQSNLPTIYNHSVYGDLICLTYFIKVVYDMRENLNSFRSFKVILCSIPNGELKERYGETIINAGRGLENEILLRIESTVFNELIQGLNPTDSQLMTSSYELNQGSNTFILQNISSETRSDLEKLYKRNNWNKARKNIRVNFNCFDVDNEDQFKWCRSEELFLW